MKFWVSDSVSTFLPSLFIGLEGYLFIEFESLELLDLLHYLF